MEYMEFNTFIDSIADKSQEKIIKVLRGFQLLKRIAHIISPPQ